MRSKNEILGPEWLDETDWLVDLVTLPDGWAEDNGESLDYIGRLFAFAIATDTRFLAQVGDPGAPTYELWFSFHSDGQKQKFLQMVRNDGYANPDEEGCFFSPASLKDLLSLRPVAQVFPKHQIDRIVDVAAMTSALMGATRPPVN